jgi:methionyl-tRNA formyltransferase
MSELSYIVAAKGEWNVKYYEQYTKKQKGIWYFVKTPDELNNLLEIITPRYIFFPHWSWIVSDEIVEEYECICFHMTDLPFGRGGSPLQNLIVRGYEDTMLTALRMGKGVDAGPIYYKKPLSLDGSAHDIYKRAGRLCWDMISNFIKENPNSVAQEGTITNFKRRTPEQSQIPEGLSSEDVYNYIRMLDAPGYPKAFLETNDYRLEFDSSDYADGRLSAKVSFIKRKE